MPGTSVPAAPVPEAQPDADLSALSTFRLPARAAELAVIDEPQQLAILPPFDGPELILGGGSNTLFIDDFAGRVVLNRLRGVRFETRGDDRVRVHAAAGEHWHSLVRRCLDEGLHGLENLAMIPGSVGAAPIQNIGAYGVELASVFCALTALDRRSGEWVRLGPEDCAFGYRDSRFKSADPGRFLITEVTLELSRRFQPRTDYASLAEALERQGHRAPEPRNLVAAIMRLRRHRLPDPGRLANAGSFFKNVVADTTEARPLIDRFPDLPHWPVDAARTKLSAAWMIEQCGWKGRRLGPVGVYAHHALVLVNHGGASGEDLMALVRTISSDVSDRFGVTLEPEPALIGAAA